MDFSCQPTQEVSKGYMAIPGKAPRNGRFPFWFPFKQTPKRAPSNKQHTHQSPGLMSKGPMSDRNPHFGPWGRLWKSVQESPGPNGPSKVLHQLVGFIYRVSSITCGAKLNLSIRRWNLSHHFYVGRTLCHKKANLIA